MNWIDISVPPPPDKRVWLTVNYGQGHEVMKAFLGGDGRWSVKVLTGRYAVCQGLPVCWQEISKPPLPEGLK